MDHIHHSLFSLTVSVCHVMVLVFMLVFVLAACSDPSEGPEVIVEPEPDMCELSGCGAAPCCNEGWVDRRKLLLPHALFTFRGRSVSGSTEVQLEGTITGVGEDSVGLVQQCQGDLEGAEAPPCQGNTRIDLTLSTGEEVWIVVAVNEDLTSWDDGRSVSLELAPSTEPGELVSRLILSDEDGVLLAMFNDVVTNGGTVWTMGDITVMPGATHCYGETTLTACDATTGGLFYLLVNDSMETAPTEELYFSAGPNDYRFTNRFAFRQDCNPRDFECAGGTVERSFELVRQ